MGQDLLAHGTGPTTNMSPHYRRGGQENGLEVTAELCHHEVTRGATASGGRSGASRAASPSHQHSFLKKGLPLPTASHPAPSKQGHQKAKERAGHGNTSA